MCPARTAEGRRAGFVIVTVSVRERVLGFWPAGLWTLGRVAVGFWPYGLWTLAVWRYLICASSGVGFGETRSSRPVPNPSPVPGALNVSKIERSMDHIGALSGL